MGMWGRYVSVQERRQKAIKEMEKSRKQGKKIEPIVINGQKIAVEFWGKKWCDHFESLADFDNRLPRGRTYVRNGSVCHLSIQEGEVEACVSGSSLYKVSIKISRLDKSKWERVKKKCNGLVGSILELLQGKLSKHVMQVVSDVKEGLFPHPEEIEYTCTCPDWAGMCKHVAAVLYGIGNRFDSRPELLFQLRGVDPQELVSAQLNLDSQTTTNVLQNDDLVELFGIQLDGDVLEQGVKTFVSSEAVPAKTKIEAQKVAQVKTQKSKVKSKAEKPISYLNPDAFTGNELKEFRTLKIMTVADMAKALGVTIASIYRWENSSELLKLQLKSKRALANLVRKK